MRSSRDGHKVIAESSMSCYRCNVRVEALALTRRRRDSNEGGRCCALSIVADEHDVDLIQAAWEPGKLDDADAGTSITFDLNFGRSIEIVGLGHDP